jgi:hypothetical protein
MCNIVIIGWRLYTYTVCIFIMYFAYNCYVIVVIKLHDILYVHLHKVKVTLQKGIFRIVKSSTSASIASKISSEKGIFHITSRKMQNVSMGYFLVLVCIQFFFHCATQITSFLHSSPLLPCTSSKPCC